MKLQTLTQSFNDGIVNIYSVDNVSQPGNKPKYGLALKVGSLRYEERTVGMGRYWTAMQSQVKVERILRVPLINTVSSQDVAILSDSKQYKIIQVQYPKNLYPHVMDLSLERLEAYYEVG